MGVAMGAAAVVAAFAVARGVPAAQMAEAVRDVIADLGRPSRQAAQPGASRPPGDDARLVAEIVDVHSDRTAAAADNDSDSDASDTDTDDDANSGSDSNSGSDDDTRLVAEIIDVHLGRTAAAAADSDSDTSGTDDDDNMNSGDDDDDDDSGGDTDSGGSGDNLMHGCGTDEGTGGVGERTAGSALPDRSLGQHNVPALPGVCDTPHAKRPACENENENDAATTERCREHSLGDPLVRTQCAMCFDADVQTAFVPCGHAIACVECATGHMLRDARLRSGDAQCPVCRTGIHWSIRIYLP